VETREQPDLSEGACIVVLVGSFFKGTSAPRQQTESGWQLWRPFSSMADLIRLDIVAPVSFWSFSSAWSKSMSSRSPRLRSTLGESTKVLSASFSSVIAKSYCRSLPRRDEVYAFRGMQLGTRLVPRYRPGARKQGVALGMSGIINWVGVCFVGH